MNRFRIIILTICTAIIIAIVVLTLKPDPSIGKLYLISSDNPNNTVAEKEKITEFGADSPGIYLIIPVKDVKTGEIIETDWLYHKEGDYKTMQEDTVDIEYDGSGEIVVYLLKRDDAYYPGDYKVMVEYNDLQEIKTSFTVNPY